MSNPFLNVLKELEEDEVVAPQQGNPFLSVLEEKEETAPVITSKPEVIEQPRPETGLGSPNIRPQYPQGLPAPTITEEEYRRPAQQLSLFGEEQEDNQTVAKSFEFGRERTQMGVKNFMADLNQMMRERTANTIFDHPNVPGVDFPEWMGPGVSKEIKQQKNLEYAAELRRQAQEHEERMKATGFAPMSFKEIEDFGDFLTYAGTTAGSSGYSMLYSMATLGLASPLLLTAELNENLRELKDLSNDERMALSMTGGFMAGALENIGLGVMVKGVPRELLARVGIVEFTEMLSKHWGGRIAQRFAESMIVEGITEAGQESVFMAAEAIGGKEFQPGELATRLQESFIGGATVGGGTGLAFKTTEEAVAATANMMRPDPPEDLGVPDIALPETMDSEAEYQRLQEERDKIWERIEQLKYPLDVDPPEPEPRLPTQFDAEPEPPQVEVKQPEIEAPKPVVADAPEAPVVKEPESPKPIETKPPPEIKPEPPKVEAPKVPDAPELKAPKGLYEKDPREIKVKYIKDSERTLLEGKPPKPDPEYRSPDGRTEKEAIDLYKKAGFKFVNKREGGTQFQNLTIFSLNKDKSPGPNVTRVGIRRYDGRPSYSYTPSGKDKGWYSSPTQRHTEVYIGEMTNSHDFANDEDALAFLAENGVIDPQLVPEAPAKPPEKKVEEQEPTAAAFEAKKKLAQSKNFELVTSTKTLKQASKALQKFTSPENKASAVQVFKLAGNEFGYSVVKYDERIPDPEYPNGKLVERGHVLLNVNNRPYTEDEALVEFDSFEEALDLAKKLSGQEAQPEPEAPKPKAKPQVAEPAPAPAPSGFQEVLDKKGKPIPAKYQKMLRGAGNLRVQGILFETGEYRDDIKPDKKSREEARTAYLPYTETGKTELQKLKELGFALGDFKEEGGKGIRLTEKGLEAIKQISKKRSLQKDGLPMDSYKPPTLPSNVYANPSRGGVMEGDYKGDPVYSNGHYLLLGKYKGRLTKARQSQPFNADPIFPDKFNDSIAEPVGYHLDDDVKTFGRGKEGFYVHLKDGSQYATIQGVYHDMFVKEFGENLKYRFDAKKGKSSPIGVYDGEKLSGLIMPIDFEGRAGDYPPGVKKLLGIKKKKEKKDATMEGGDFDTSAQISFDNVGPEAKPETKQRRPTGRSRTDDEMLNRKSAVFEQAYRDAGLDPDVAKNLPPKKQRKILADLVKKKFGFPFIQFSKDPETGKKYNIRNDLDNLLTMYAQLQTMATVLQMPDSMIGLNGTLGLGLPGKSWGGYYAAFFNELGGKLSSSQTQTDLPTMEAPFIIMPTFAQVGKPNAFAHEWGHALDYHILSRLGKGWSRGLSGRLRNLKKDESAYEADIDSADNPPLRELQLAMGEVMNSLFFNFDSIASEIMELEQEIAKRELKHVRAGKKIGENEPKVLKDLRNDLNRVLEGASKKKMNRSQYLEDVQTFTDEVKKKTGKDTDYWKRPTEMFARAWESYIAHLVTKAGAGTDFLTMSDAAYQLTLDEVSGSDIRLPLTHPQASERHNIFIAFHRLVNAMRKLEMFEGPTAEMPEPNKTVDILRYMQGQPEVGLFGESATAENNATILSVKRQLEREKARPIDFADKSLMERTFIKVHDQFLAPWVWTKRSTLFTLSKRYKGKPARKYIEEIISMVADDPGGTRPTWSRPEAEGIGTFEEATGREVRRYANRYKRIVIQHKVDQLGDGELLMLRKLLTSDPKIMKMALRNQLNPEILKAAGAFRNMLNDLYQYAKKAGVDISFLDENAYLPRVLDTPLVWSKSDQFLYGSGGKTGAIPLFHDVIWAETYGKEYDGSMDQLENIYKLSGKQEFKHLWKDQGETDIAEMRSVVRKLRKLQKELEATKEMKPGIGNNMSKEDIRQQKQRLKNEIKDLIKENKPALKSAYDELRGEYAEMAGHDWFNRIKIMEGEDPAAHAPYGRFTERRVFPPEADTYMAEFYKDADEAIRDYITNVIRKAEWEKRFGKSRVPQKEKLGIDNKPRDYLDYLLQEKLSKDVTSDDIRTIRSMVKFIAGMQEYVPDRSEKRMLDRIHAYGTMAMLPRAWMSAAMEPVTAGITAKSTIAGFKSLALTIEELISVGGDLTAGTDAAQRVRTRRHLAELLGIIDDPKTGLMMANRLGGSYMDSPKYSSMMANFFRVTGLQGITNASRRSAMAIGATYIRQMAHNYLEPVGNTETSKAKDKERHRQILSDFGVPLDNMDSFSEYLTNQENPLISVEELIDTDGSLTAEGRIYAQVLGRFVDRSIQDPKRVDRQKKAEEPYGRLVYGIQGFIASFSRNVLLAQAKQLKRNAELTNFKAPEERKNMYQYVGQQMLLPMVSLYVAHTLFNALRERFTNPDRWEDEKKRGTLMEYLMWFGVSRSGFTGMADPFYQALTSLKYQTDLVNILVGASPSFFLREIEKELRLFINNSEKTVAAEYQALVGLYKIVIHTLTAMAISNPGFGNRIRPYTKQFTDLTLMLGGQVITSPGATHGVAREIIKQAYGVDYYPGRGGRKKAGMDETGLLF